MPLTIADLDGRYRVTTISDYTGPLPMQSDGETEIKNGKTSRTDKKGCRWSTDIKVLSDDEVKFISVADASDAHPDFCLTNARGQPTRQAVTYETVLKVSRKGDKLKLSGQIAHGKTVTVITMMKI